MLLGKSRKRPSSIQNNRTPNPIPMFVSKTSKKHIQNQNPSLRSLAAALLHSLSPRLPSPRLSAPEVREHVQELRICRHSEPIYWAEESPTFQTPLCPMDQGFQHFFFFTFCEFCHCIWAACAGSSPMRQPSLCVVSAYCVHPAQRVPTRLSKHRNLGPTLLGVSLELCLWFGGGYVGVHRSPRVSGGDYSTGRSSGVRSVV